MATPASAVHHLGLAIGFVLDFSLVQIRLRIMRGLPNSDPGSKKREIKPGQVF